MKEGSLEIHKALELVEDHNETKATNFDIETSSHESESSMTLRSVLKPSSFDLVPLILFIFVSLLVIAVSLAVYYPLQAQELDSLNANVRQIMAVEVPYLQAAIQQTKSSIVYTTGLCTVTKGIEGLTLYAFSQFLYNGDNRNTYIGEMYFLSNVPKSNVTTFPTYLKQKDPIGYSNFSYRSGKDPNSAPDACNGDMCLPVTLEASGIYSEGDLIGWNHYSDPKRAALIQQAYLSPDQVAITSFLDTSNALSVIYLPVYDFYSTQLYGFVYAEISVQKLIEGSLVYVNSHNSTSLNPYYDLKVYEGAGVGQKNLTYSTFVKSMNDLNRSEVFVEGANMFVTSIDYGGLNWTLVFIPTPYVYNQLYNPMKFAGVIAMFSLWLLIIIVCIAILVASRIRRVIHAKNLIQKKITILLKYEPKEFLRLIQKRGKKTKLVLGYVELGGLSKVDASDVCDVMCSYYSHIKNIANKHSGFVYQSYNNGFLLLFPDASEAIDAAINMQTIPSVYEVNIRTSLHYSESTLINMIQDHDTYLQSIITSGLNVMESLCYFCNKYNKKVIVSSVIHNMSRKVQQKEMLFMGAFPVISSEGYVRAYEVVNELEQTEVKILMSEVMGNIYDHDYVKAADNLKKVISKDPTNSEAIEINNQIQFRIKSCMSLSTYWNVTDTLQNTKDLVDAFNSFLNKEHSEENYNMWRDLKELSLDSNPSSRKDSAAAIYQKYLVESDININESLKTSMTNQLLYEDQRDIPSLIPELEILMSDAHKRFRTSNEFINIMCARYKTIIGETVH